MFRPNFNYTNKIVNNLTDIAESKSIVLNAPLIPKWEVKLRSDAILRSAHSSTAIEGNSLSFEEVTALASGRKIMGKRKDKLEVLNYLDALERIPDFDKNPFKLDDLLKIHYILSQGTLENPSDEGVLRNRQVYVGNSNGVVIFMPPETEKVPYLINEFLSWFNSLDFNELNPVIVAGLAHYELVRIHPFIDGNGRTARIIATLALYKSGFDLKRFFTLDDYYDSNRQNYYAALETVDPETLDLTQWLEYFTDGVSYSIKAVKEKVIGISKNINLLKKEDQTSLNERQMKIVKKIVDDGKITNKDIRDMFSISDAAARKETSKLQELDVIKKEGSGRSIYYVLVN